MSQIILKVLKAACIAGLALALFPWALVAVSAAMVRKGYRRMELKALYGGDEALRAREEYRIS